MPLRLILATALLFVSTAASPAIGEQGKAGHIVMVVWDGMRPDFINNRNTPTLASLARSGVFFRNNRAAYPSSTNVNGAVLATGLEPGHNGVIANQEFRSEVDAHKPFDTADFTALDAADGRINARHLATPTIAELVQQTGYRTAIAGAKPVAQFFDRSRRRESEAARRSTVVYRGKVLPTDAEAAIVAALGPFPLRRALPNESEDAWTTRALTQVLWKEEVPKFSLLWLSEPDLSEHETAPGSPKCLAAIKSSDQNLARILAALEAKNALTTTDIFVVSDHGFSTIGRAFDVAAQLRAAGLDAVREFTEPPPRGQILTVSLGGSIAFYVVDHAAATIGKLVDFLQRSDFAGVILTRTAHSGAFTLAQAQVAAPNAPDVLAACRWNAQPNESKIAGEITSDIGRSAGHGTHSTLGSPDLHNTLIASGPDFRRGWMDETPSGNIDLAPTILCILGIKPPRPLDGRVLREAFVDAREPPPVEAKTAETQRDLGDRIWRQHLRTATVDGVTYLIEGNGASTPVQP
jgi:arylsulfatase A-like enzyme